MVDLNLQVNGLDKLGEALLQLPTELAAKELLNSLKAGGNVVADEMSAQAPRQGDIGPREKSDQHIADSIVVQAEKNSIGSAAEVYVGPNAKVAWRARFIELGTAAHALIARRKKVLSNSEDIFGKKAEHPGIHPRPFMRSSLAVSAEKALAAIRQSLADGIQRTAKRVKKN